MKKFFKTFLTSNDWEYRTLRTISQGIIGVIIANLDYLIGTFVIDPTMKGIITAAVMAILSPIYAELGKSLESKEGGAK